MTTGKKIYAPLRAPYYIFAPPYRDTSGGIRVLHNLCHALNLAGEEAYVLTDGVNPSLRTPTLTDVMIKRHRTAGLEPIVVYPEVVSGNPLNAKAVVRFLLNDPGKLTGSFHVGEHDLFACHGATLFQEGRKNILLSVPHSDTRIFNNFDNDDSERSGTCFFVHRYLAAGHPLLDITKDSVEISPRVPHRSLPELATLLRKSELMYAYEPSTLCYEALLSGCPVVYLPNPYMQRLPGEHLGTDGIAWGTSPEAIAHAKATVGKVFEQYQKLEEAFWAELDVFIETTQQHALEAKAFPASKTDVFSNLAISVTEAGIPPAQQEKESAQQLGLPAGGTSTAAAAPAALRSGMPVRRIRIGLLTADRNDLACFSIRVQDPLSLLGQYVEVVRIAKSSGNSTASYYLREELLDTCDLYLVQRLFPSQETSAALEKVFASGRPVLYETDDLLDDIPPENGMYDMIRPRIPFIRDTIRRATAVVVSTEELQSHYRPLNLDITVFPNYLCEERWRGVRTISSADGVVTIGFAGTGTHKPDIKMVENAILKAARHFGDRIRFVFWGAISDELRSLPNCVWIHNAVSYFQYPQRLAELGFDIGLIPLADTPFNRGKSNVKWLEYSMLGIASICSDVEPYADAKRQGLAVVVPNDENAWFDAIVRLVEDTGLRQRLAEAARNYVQGHYRLDQHLGQYASWLNRFVPVKLRLPQELYLQPLPPQHEDDFHILPDDYEIWRDKHQMQEVDAEVLAERMMRWPKQPTVAVVTVVKGADLAHLAGTIDALQRQLYPRWKLVVVSDRPSPDPIFENTDILGWLQIDDAGDDALVAQAVSEVLSIIGTDFFCLVPPGTQFEPQAFVLILDYFQRHPEWMLAYTDHDFLDGNGERRRPAFKPDFNLDLLRSSSYIGDAVFFRSNAVIAAGGIQPYPLAETFELVLRLLDIHGEKAMGHVAEPLVSLPLRKMDTQLREASQRVAVESHLERSGIAAEISPGLLPGTQRVKYLHAGTPLVSIVIPNRDKIEVLEPCLESLFGKTSYPNFEVIVVDNQSEDPDVLALYAAMAASYGERFRVVNYDAPFNFAAQINLGASVSRGELLLLLNNDCEIVQPDWLERMLHHARRPEVGAVGALLLAPESGQVQQAGILLGPPGTLLSVSSDAFAGCHIHEAGYLSRLQVDQNYSAVTAACMLVRHDVFKQAGGFDAENFAVRMGDVDFCLRLGKAGYKNVWTPYARVVHHVGRSLKGITSDPEKVLQTLMRERQESLSMLRRWLPVLADDPAGNRHLSLKDAGMHLETRVTLGWDPKIHDRNRVLGFPLVGGSGEYRVAMPLRALAKAGLMHTEQVQPQGGKTQEISIIEMARQAPDSLLLHSTVNIMMQETLPVWKDFFPKVRVVFGLDDRMDRIPEKSSVYLGHKRGFSDVRLSLRKMLKLCDAAVVSTEPLAGMVRDMIGDVRVIPNALERESWEHLRPQRRAGKKPRVGWVGAQQHRGDLELIHEVVKATANDVEWVFMGMWLPEFSEYVHERHQFVAFKNYPAKMASLNLDLAIAPLEIHEFNEAKSNLRLLEYGVLGFPVICTDIFPYQTLDAPVTRLSNDPQRWIEAIQDKVRDLDQLAREGDTLRTWVLKNFMMDQHVNAWYDVLSPQG